jgi:hypothetical protein
MSKIETIAKLANLYNTYGLTRDFLEVMYVYEKVKVGYTPQLDGNKELLIFKEKFFPYLKELGLFVSFKHGGYVTNNGHLFKSWNGWRYYFKSKLLGSYYLGYPDCCQWGFSLTGTVLYGLTLYLALKKILKNKSRNDLVDLKSIQLAFHKPCTVYCRKTKELAPRFVAVYEKYKQILKPGFLAKRKLRIKDYLLNDLQGISKKVIQDNLKRKIKQIHKLRSVFDLDESFFEEAKQFLNNPDNKFIAEMEIFVKKL